MSSGKHDTERQRARLGRHLDRTSLMDRRARLTSRGEASGFVQIGEISLDIVRKLRGG